MSTNPESGTEATEPESAKVDDWFGQNVARDQDVADQVAEETDSDAEAEAAFEQRADGEERYEEGHDRPSDEPQATGDKVGRKGDQ